jgi:dihydrofolate reductase
MRLHVIAAVSENYCIGIDGRLPWNVPPDLENFKRLTVGKSIIMGRGCYESIGRPLPDRKNVVLTRSDIEIPGCIVAHTIDTAILYAEHFSEDIFVIGGQDIYEEFLPPVQ